MSSSRAKQNRPGRRLTAVYRRGFEDGRRAALEAALSAEDPVCCGKTVHEGSPEAYTLECCGKFVQSAPSVAVKAEQPEGTVGDMTPDRAIYFLKRFKGDEKMLGPHEQWALDFSISALSAQVQDVATHRHKKRGTEYVLIGIGKVQAEDWFCWPKNKLVMEFVDMREVAIYRSVDDGSLWVRPVEEFNDGRFEPLPAAPAKQEGGSDGR